MRRLPRSTVSVGRWSHIDWFVTPGPILHSYLDGNLHFSCLERSDKRDEFHAEFVHLIQAGHEEVPGLEASHPSLTRMGLSMAPVFSGDECDIFQSELADRWMLVKKTGPWFGFGLP